MSKRYSTFKSFINSKYTFLTVSLLVVFFGDAFVRWKRVKQPWWIRVNRVRIIHGYWWNNYWNGKVLKLRTDIRYNLFRVGYNLFRAGSTNNNFFITGCTRCYHDNLKCSRQWNFCVSMTTLEINRSKNMRIFYWKYCNNRSVCRGWVRTIAISGAGYLSRW